MKILIVEDDIISRELFRVVIQKEGYECVFAEDGIQALEVFNEFMPDLVLSDIRMPRLDGIGLLKRIRQVERNVIVIMVTAHGNEEIALQALQSGANNYLKKPVNLEELKILLSRYSNILQNKALKQEISSLVINRKIEMEVDSDFDLVPSIAEYLVHQIKYLYTPSELISIELGLSELILNAIEHGSYNITSLEKQHALKSNTLADLYNERRLNKEFASRKIKIGFEQKSDCCEWIIEDQGEGFDWQFLPAPSFDRLVSELHGRGVFISKLQFDNIDYVGKGNVVIAKKNIIHDRNNTSN